MGGNRFNVKVIFPINEPENFSLETDVRTEFVPELIFDFLRSQIGGGVDESLPEERDVYNIHLQLNLEGDIWCCKHDCGNLGLRDGILLDVLKRLNHV